MSKQWRWVKQTELVRIGELAIKAQRLRETADKAKREFADAVRDCIDWHKSDEHTTVWMFRWGVDPDDDNGNEKCWIDANGNDASNHPLVVRNQEAYRAMREARKQAGIAKAVLTRAIKRLRT